MIMRKYNKSRSRRHQNGIGIVEVLVALVVVSFGVLGMASLQLTGMKHSSGGFNRSKALLYAQSMATRIRLNDIGVETLKYGGFDSSTLNCATPPVTYCQARVGVANTPSCNPEQLAEFDLYAVSCGDAGTDGADKGVVGTLPNGALTVTCLGGVCTPASSFQISVTWTEGRSRTTTDELVTRRVQVRLKP